MIPEGLNSQKGLTLVEILAALVILGIIFIGFMTIFPQMTLFNEKTATKLETMNLAEQEITRISAPDKWKETESRRFLSEDEIKAKLTADHYVFDRKDDSTGVLHFSRTDDYTYLVDFHSACSPLVDGTVCTEEDRIKLHKLHVKVEVDSRISSETYGFVPYTYENAGVE